MPEFHGVLPALITRSQRTAPTSTPTRWPPWSTGSSAAVYAGLVPGGTTGEFTTLTNAERRAVIEMTVEAAAGRVPVVAGTGALSTRETVELSLHAEHAGATAVMVVPPFYEALGWHELLAHYTAVAEAISIPIMYYNPRAPRASSSTPINCVSCSGSRVSPHSRTPAATRSPPPSSSRPARTAPLSSTAGTR